MRGIDCSDEDFSHMLKGDIYVPGRGWLSPEEARGENNGPETNSRKKEGGLSEMSEKDQAQQNLLHALDGDVYIPKRGWVPQDRLKDAESKDSASPQADSEDPVKTAGCIK